jgi:hypothetical protein
MNVSSLTKHIVQRFSILLVILNVTAVAFAGGRAQRSEEHKSAPSRPASHASHPAPHASHPASHTSHPASHAAPARHSGEHAANRGKATGGRTATTRHTPGAGGRTEATKHASANAHTTGAHTATTRHSSPRGRVATTGHTPVAEHTANIGHSPTAFRNVSLKGGGSARIRPNGQIRSVDHNGMHIDHGFSGRRTVVTEHNGVRVVNTGRSSGYVQRPYMTVRGHSYYSRTYYFHGSYHTAVYRGYYWHGHAYYGFHAGFWFHPGFYAWGYHPWGAPVYWGIGAWGWRGAPWWGFYSGWFTPYPYYTAPAYWLTDYLIAAELQSAYEARQDAEVDAAVAAASYGGEPAPATSASTTVTLTPEVKEAIADEVKAELAEQQAEAEPNGGSAQATPTPATAPSSAPVDASAESKEQVPPALDPSRRTFVVDSDLSVTANGQECGMSAGDVLTRLSDTPDANNMVSASVSASKKSDCAAGLTVSVKVDDLQEMQNHFDEQVDNGMKELAQKQGTDGMPKAPDTGIVESDIPAPQPDPTTAKTLQDQQEAADQAETQVKQEAAAAAPPDAQ